jgi:hypothetical protein
MNSTGRTLHSHTFHFNVMEEEEEENLIELLISSDSERK